MANSHGKNAPAENVRHLTSEQLDAVSKAFLDWYKASVSTTQGRSRGRLWLVFLLIRYGALRLGEVLSLDDRTDLDFARSVVSVRGQFIAVGLWGMGASVFSIVFTTFVINLRHVLMSAAVAPWFAPFTRFQQFIIGWGLTDEVFAMHSMAMATGEKARLPLVYAANFTSHSGWVLGTFIGAVAGDFLPDPKLFGLDYALPAMFLALLVPQCKERLYTLAAVLSALLSVILAMYDTGRWNVIIASVITSTIGALLVTHRDRNIDALRRKA